METFLAILIIWVFSVCLHEFGHAYVALKGGDYTVREKGYLEMNPLHYADPLFSFVLPILFVIMGGIGLPGGAVYIERHLIRSRGWLTAMSLAGPAMNVLIINALCIPFWFGLVPQDPTSLAACTLGFAIQLQISAVLFNLLPVPPLDGFQAISAWMPEVTREQLLAHANTFTLVLFMLMWNVQPLSQFFWGVVHLISYLLGVNPQLGYEGYLEFRFWAR